MSLSAVIKFGYTIVVVTFLLMIWASLSRALELHMDLSETPPCIFNPLCTCTKPMGDLGIVQCRNVPLFKIPERINGSKVFILHLENNGIMDLDPYFFQSTGLYGLVINNNPLQDIPDDALLGLEKSLCELVLRNNQLTSIPSKSFRYMQKLKTLDLTGNEITDLAGDSWKGLENSLHVLIMADNSIANLPPDAFSGLPLLETLDLHGNHLQSIDPTVFRDGMMKLNKLLLQDNQLTAIPYDEISPLKQLRYLDLSRNIIRQVQPDIELQNIKLSLNTLRLEHNAIEELVPMSFKYFSIVNTTILDGNPLDIIREDAFQQAKIKTLSLRDCGLTEISPAAFAGLENTLQNLDLSSNNLTILPRSLFHQFDSLRTLNLKENKVDSITPSESFNGFQFTLYHLDLSGKTNGAVSLQDVRRMRSLRSLSVSKLIHKSLDEEDFSEYGVELESLSITGSTISKINKNAFHNVRTIKTLDLSENNIEVFDHDAFRDLGHMLITLKLSNGLADSVTYFPAVLSSLYNLQNLDLSNNRIRNVPDTALLSLLNIKRLELQDNVIEDFYKGTLQGEQHKSLEVIILSMNRLRKVHQHTFVELETLREIGIEDNLIEHIERRSFLNLISLNKINLRGNRISDLSDEAFQNLPALTELDLSFNHLGTFDFTMFDQVGTLSSLKVNASYNRIRKCSDVMSYSDGREPAIEMEEEASLLVKGSGSIVNIKVLDLSHNNITYIGDFYFRHVASSLTHLHLEHNQLKNVTKSMFNNMPQLMYLDLSHNQIHHLQPSTFREVQQLQILSLKHNYLLDIPPEFFKRLSMLKIVELNKNLLRSLPDNLFTERGLERLDLSNNELSRIPTNALSNGASATLVHWDLSGNIIPAIASSDLAQRFRTEDFFERQMFDADWQEDDYSSDQNSYVYHSVQRPNSKVIHQRTQSQHKVLFKSLSWLDLSENKLVRIEGNSFSSLPKLRWLDMSNNKDLVLEKGSGIFRGLERRLINLGLRNISMSMLPPLPLARLKSLDLSHNDLPSIPSDSATNLTQLRKLDLSYNDLTTVPIVTHTFSELKWLSLSGNPISTLTNTSLYGVSGKLEYLDVTRLKLKSMERGVFSKMCALRTLKVTAYVKIRDFNIPKLVSYNAGLKNLLIEVLTENINLGQEMSGPLPCKLNNLTITGRSLTYLSDSILYGMHNAELRLTLYNTSISKIDQALFWHAGRVRNVTLDLRNNDLTTVANPSTGEWPGIPNTVFLNDIYLTNNPLVCDCGLGWIEVWERKRRQYFCGDVIGDHCMSSRDDLRSSRCADAENRTLIDMFQNELECGWNSVEGLFTPKIYYIIGIAIATMLYI